MRHPEDTLTRQVLLAIPVFSRGKNRWPDKISAQRRQKGCRTTWGVLKVWSQIGEGVAGVSSTAPRRQNPMEALESAASR